MATKAHITHPGSTQRDNRYTITLEYTGAQNGKPEYVVRFCDTFIDSFATRDEAVQAGNDHNIDRLAPYTRGVMAPVMQAGRISQGVRHG